MFTVPLLKGSEVDGTVWTWAALKNLGGRVFRETVTRERPGLREENHEHKTKTKPCVLSGWDFEFIL